MRQRGMHDSSDPAGLTRGGFRYFPVLAAKPHIPDYAPDSYAIRFIGYEEYVKQYRLNPIAPGATDVAEHAAGIAWKLQGADPLASTFVVLSLNLLDPVLEAIQVPQ